ncbi:hypothetical protein [Dickeya fangzhongdai]|uniref:Uncharacterized protein n=1 Tax=Dickeya fangzhongdai TaxID=1778540 RepID=A0A2K8QHV5_9GAMM|nr:hypothetical protein [Dickeya fangzhongdai]ATZ93054.1 hypothetical protein CVE23_03120 [Dickeya fangzhongdai]QOH46485.1 hypothetical protein DYD82_03155 [Dickeya fangzhongdai]QOH50791.1 hypothetical protein DYD83_03155 [Dickeya fangzhongdai]GGB97843.1 hypothetical protein GCM10007171_13680 [Dickeya fangzhongdai]
MSTMFRFTSLTLRPVFELQKALNGTRNIVIPDTPLRLVKVGPTVCLRVDDAYHHDGQIVRQASAEAEQNAGEPNTDDFARSFFFHHAIYGQVLDDLCDLIITLNGTSQHIETRRFEKVWVPVATLRQETERVFNLAHQHFCACKGDAELATWRITALRALDEVVRLSSKRAKATDLIRHADAIRALRMQISDITPEGKYRHRFGSR